MFPAPPRPWEYFLPGISRLKVDLNCDLRRIESSCSYALSLCLIVCIKVGALIYPGPEEVFHFMYRPRDPAFLLARLHKLEGNYLWPSDLWPPPITILQWPRPMDFCSSLESLKWPLHAIRQLRIPKLCHLTSHNPDNRIIPRWFRSAPPWDKASLKFGGFISGEYVHRQRNLTFIDALNSL